MAATISSRRSGSMWFSSLARGSRWDARPVGPGFAPVCAFRCRSGANAARVERPSVNCGWVAVGSEPPATPARCPPLAGPLSQRLLIQREPDRAAHGGDDPEAQDDLRLRPGAELEVVVDRRHQEHALAERLEARDLDQHR